MRALRGLGWSEPPALPWAQWMVFAACRASDELKHLLPFPKEYPKAQSSHIPAPAWETRAQGLLLLQESGDGGCAYQSLLACVLYVPATWFSNLKWYHCETHLGLQNSRVWYLTMIHTVRMCHPSALLSPRCLEVGEKQVETQHKLLPLPYASSQFGTRIPPIPEL